MQFITTPQLLDRGLSIVGHALVGKALRPIESYILASTDGERVRLSARGENIGIHCWVPVSQIEEEGMALLPAKLITDVVGNLPSSPVTLTSPSPTDETSCNLRCLRISSDMKNTGQDPDEFPSIPLFSQSGELLFQLDADLLKEIISQVAFAASDKDDGRPALTGVYLEIGAGEALFVAADAYRLAARTISIPDDQLCRTLLLPAKTMEELAKILPGQGSVQILLTGDHHQALFHTEIADLSTPLLNETFPNVHPFFSQAWTTRAIMQTQELSSYLRLLLPFARENKNSIRFTLYGESGENFSVERESNMVKLEAVARDMGNNQNVLQAQVDGPDQVVHLHVKYLLDVLSVIETAEVVLEVTSGGRLATIKPVGPLNYVYVIMPMSQDLAVPGHTTASPERNGHVPVASAR